jgi:DUF1680 family protein
MRFLATFPDLVATTSERGIQLHQYVTGSFEAPVKGGVARVRTGTTYPWDGAVEITVSTSVAEPWTLSMRVPGWCTTAVASVEGESVQSSDSGVIELTRVWHEDDRVALTLQMPPRATEPDPRIDAIRGSLALERGPLVYAVEDADLAPGESVESVEIAAPPSLEATVESEPGLGELTWLSFDALVRADPPDRAWPYRSADAAATVGPARRTRLRALPYFAWANRAGLGMRIWIPARRREPTA